MNAVRVLCLAALAFALGGCNTIQSRIREKPEVFAGLDPVTQNKIKKGIIEPGFPPDMVYLARGDPDRIKEDVVHGHRLVTWIYSFPHERISGAIGIPAEGIAPNGAAGSHHADREPDITLVAPRQTVRVVFRDGRVSSIASTD